MRSVAFLYRYVVSNSEITEKNFDILHYNLVQQKYHLIPPRVARSELTSKAIQKLNTI